MSTLKDEKNYEVILLGLLFLSISCHEDREKDEARFDQQLMAQNTNLLNAGEYVSIVKLNAEFYKKAAKMGYEDGKALCYMNLADVNSQIRKYEQAKLFFTEAGEILKSSNNNLHKAKFYSDNGDYYADLTLYDQAIACNNKALYFLDKSQDSEVKKRILQRAYIQRGDCLTSKRQFTIALNYFHKAKNVDNSALSNCRIARHHLLTGRLDSAKMYVLQSIKMNRGKEDNMDSFWVCYTAGYYYNEINHYPEAENRLEKALKIATGMKDTYSFPIRDISQELAKLYKKKGENEKSFFYLSQYMDEQGEFIENRSAALNNSTDSLITDLNADFEKSRRNLTLCFILFMGILLLSGLYILRYIKNIHRKKNIINRKVEELKEKAYRKKLEEVKELVKKNDSSFLIKFKVLEPDFTTQLLTINPELEPSELAFCVMLKLSFSSQEIADYTFVQRSSVQQRKYRIRKRLDIPGTIDLYTFLNDLI